MTQKNNSSLHFEELFRSLGTAYIVFDVNDPEFTIIEENQAHAEMAMANRKNVLGKPVVEALSNTPEAYRVEILESIRKVIATGKPDMVPNLRYDVRGKKGALVTKFLEVTHYPICEKNVVEAICQQTNDVTHRYKLENQRMQHYIDLNKTKDEFISLASHQLRTPATGVKQYLGMVLEGMAGDVTETQQALLQKAYESNERQLTIVSELLKVAKIDAGKVRLNQKRVNVAELLSDVIKEQEHTYAMRKQKLQFTMLPLKPMAFIDPDKMRMVFENLIDNASKYSDPSKLIRVTLTEKDNTIVVAIHDNGVGVARGDIAKLFEKFNRIHNHLSNYVGGTGLGLYWAKSIVDLHGGVIKVTSVLGKGSTFTVYLPRNKKISKIAGITGGTYEK